MTVGVTVSDTVSSVREEVANSLTHGVGALAAVAAIPILAVAASGHGAAQVVGAVIFASTMVLLYFSSALYHAWPAGIVKRRLQIVDHSAIYLLIAGTYTPFTLGVLRGGWGWTLFGLIWGFAVLGIALKAMGGVRYKVLSLSLYLGMGWLVLIAIRPLWQHVPTAGFVWLLGGGIAYTLGVPFYTARRLPYGHCIWHVFVLIGSVCHFFAVLWYAF